MSARRVDTTEAWIWSCFTLRTGASPSISSKKMMEGCPHGASGPGAGTGAGTRGEGMDTHSYVHVIPTATHAGPMSA